MLAPVDPADPTWFPFDVDVTGGRLQWLRIDEELIVDSAFLDPRMPAAGRPQALTALAPTAGLVLIAFSCRVEESVFSAGFCHEHAALRWKALYLAALASR